MSNFKGREAGYYLVRYRDTVYWKDGNQVRDLGVMGIEYIEDDCIWDSRREEDIPVGDYEFSWIADEPLDLEKIKFITENYEIFVD